MHGQALTFHLNTSWSPVWTRLKDQVTKRRRSYLKLTWKIANAYLSAEMCPKKPRNRCYSTCVEAVWSLSTTATSQTLSSLRSQSSNQAMTINMRVHPQQRLKKNKWMTLRSILRRQAVSNLRQKTRTIEILPTSEKRVTFSKLKLNLCNLLLTIYLKSVLFLQWWTKGPQRLMLEPAPSWKNARCLCSLIAITSTCLSPLRRETLWVQ